MKTKRFNVIPSLPDSRDYKIKAVKPKQLPEFVDLRPRLRNVKDQGNTGACAAFAASTIKEFHETKSGLKLVVSPAFIYAHREDQEVEGMTGRDVMRILMEIGSVPEKYWRGRYHNTMKIPAFLYDIAQEFKIAGFARCNTIEAVKTAINTHGALWMAVPTHIIPGQLGDALYPNDMWNGGYGRQKVGYHAMAIVGYDDLKERLIIRNSWGVHWGLHGNTYMDYKDFGEVIECWTFIDAVTADIFKKRGKLKKKVRKLFGKKK